MESFLKGNSDGELELSTQASSGATLPKREKHRRTADEEPPNQLSGEDTSDSETVKLILKDELTDTKVSPATPDDNSKK